MDANEVGRLIRGSHNIDRMRKEIEEVVGMVLGYATRIPRAPDEKEIATFFKTWNWDWEVLGTTGCVLTLKAGQFIVRCWLRPGRTQGRFLAYSSHLKEIPLYPENVQSVYQSLPDFVDGMIQLLPELEDKLQPLLKASEVIFTS